MGESIRTLTVVFQDLQASDVPYLRVGEGREEILFRPRLANQIRNKKKRENKKMILIIVLPFAIPAAMGIAVHLGMYFEHYPIFGHNRPTIKSYLAMWR